MIEGKISWVIYGGLTIIIWILFIVTLFTEAKADLIIILLQVCIVSVIIICVIWDLHSYFFKE